MDPRVPSSAHSPAFLDHLTNPRQSGAIARPTHRGEAIDVTCGDRLTLDLDVVDGVVRDARFRVEGCPAAIAAGSVLASLAIGRTGHVESVTSGDIETALGGVPSGKRHALRLAIETWKAAVRTRVP